MSNEQSDKPEERYEYELFRCWGSHKTRFRVIAEGPTNTVNLRALQRVLESQIAILEADPDAAMEKAAPAAPPPPEEPIPHPETI